ncbi:hypothetical protein ACTAQJ_13855 [Arthrobacter sp. alpha11c]
MTTSTATPGYSLPETAPSSESTKLVITVFITQAADGQLTLAFDNYPGLSAIAGSFADIPEVAGRAAAGHTGKPQGNFAVHIRF